MFLGEAAALLTALCWVGSSVAFEYAGKKVGTLVLNLMRLVVSFAIMTVINFFLTKGYQNLAVTPEAFGILLLSGLIGFVLGDLFLFQAYIDIGARIAQLIMALSPPITALLSFILLGETLGFFQILGMLIATGGIMTVITGRGEGRSKLVLRHSLKGVVAAFIGALGQSLGLILSKIGVRDLSPFLATQIRILAGIIGFFLIISYTKNWGEFFRTLRWKEVMQGITIGSLFGPVVGVSLSLVAVKYTSTAVASTLMALTPVFLIPISVFFFKEKVTPHEIFGTILAVFGVAVIFIG